MSLKNYKEELLKVKIDLLKDPNNKDLLELKSDLVEMIELEGGNIEDIKQPKSNLYEVGTIVGAKYTDGISYKATINNILDNIYVVQFVGFPELYNLKADDICEFNKEIMMKGTKNNTEYMKKKKEKKKLRLQEKVKQESKEHMARQQKWQKFKKGPISNSKIAKVDDTIGIGSLNRLHK